MFSNKTKEKIEKLFESQYCEVVERLVPEEFKTLSGDEELLMKLLYATLPIEDLSSVSFDTLMSYVSHFCFLYENVSYVKEMPEDFLLHDVFYPRVGTEKLVCCRSFFYEKITEEISLSEMTDLSELVLLVNRFSMGEMTYHMADLRTQNPLISFIYGDGRCGEESVFLVTALRSIGIPARQVYVPFWSHCDDNHAWVEVYINGTWQFLGACEYEPVLNKGWFNRAASRALLVHSRTFFEREEGTLITKKGAAYYYNETNRYAKTEKIRFSFVNFQDELEKKIKIRFYIPNESVLSPIAEMNANPSENAEIELGLGTVLAVFTIGGKNVKRILHISEGFPVVSIDFSVESADDFGKTPVEFTSFAPDVQMKCPVVLTDEEQKKKEEVVRKQNAHLLHKISTRETFSSELQDLISLYPKDAELLFSLLNEKDQRDLPREVFLRFINEKKVTNADLENNLSEEVICQYVLNPRIDYEELSDVSKEIRTFFTEEELQAFKKDPLFCKRYIESNFTEKTDRYYDEMFMTPSSVLNAKEGSKYGRDLLFVSMMRMLHIPAFYDRQMQRTFFYEKDSFVSSVSEPETELTVMDENENGNAVTKILKESNGIYMPVHVLHRQKEKITLPYGTYLLLSARRLPSGNQKVFMKEFLLDEKHVGIEFSSPEEREEELLSSYEVPSFLFVGEKNMSFLLSPLEEPTAHILNELLEEQLPKNLPVHFYFLKENEHQTSTDVFASSSLVKRVCRAMKDQVQIHFLTALQMEEVSRSLFLEPGVFPVSMLLHEKGMCRFGTSGYAVGTVHLLNTLQSLLE